MALFRTPLALTRQLTKMTRLRYLLVVDFEATCDNSGAVVPRGEMEVIELPTLLYDMEEDKVQATFHEYVRPVKHSTLTKFCTDLTGIEQVSVWNDTYSEILHALTWRCVAEDC